MKQKETRNFPIYRGPLRPRIRITKAILHCRVSRQREVVHSIRPM